MPDEPPSKEGVEDGDVEDDIEDGEEVAEDEREDVSPHSLLADECPDVPDYCPLADCTLLLRTAKPMATIYFWKW